MKYEATYEHQIHHSFQIHSVTEVLVISTRETRANTVVHIHHTSHAVKTEAVELIFFQPELEIAEQEPQDFVTSVVE